MDFSPPRYPSLRRGKRRREVAEDTPDEREVEPLAVERHQQAVFSHFGREFLEIDASYEGPGGSAVEQTDYCDRIGPGVETGGLNVDESGAVTEVMVEAPALD
jgi:hypothetical protein